MSCLVTISYVACLVFLAFSDDATQSSAPAVRSGVQQEFAAAPGRSPSAPLDPRQTDNVIASLIDQATAAAAAGRFEEARLLEQAAHQAARAGVNHNGASSPQVETALAQALPPSESATAADRPETVGKTDQPILFPKLAAPAPPDAVPDQPVNVTQRAQVAMVPDGASAPAAADLPAFAPIRAVLTFARDNVGRAERTAAIRQALMDAEVEVSDLAAVDAQRPRPSIGYYFQSDRHIAVDVSRRLEPLFGAIEPIVLQLRGRVPAPGTIEITNSDYCNQTRIMCDSGLGTAQNPAEAAIWYTSAAAHGNARAEYNLAQLYQAGEGVPRNLDMAEAWYSAAAAHGLSSAASKLVSLRDARGGGAVSAAANPTLAPAIPTGPPVTPVLGKGESVQVELSWAAPPQPVPVDFFVQVLALDTVGTHPIFASYLKRSAIVVLLPRTSARYAWRVYTVGTSVADYVPSAWSYLFER
jgi:hypothetical protein